MLRILSLSKAAGLPSWKRYENIFEWEYDLAYKTVCVTVTLENEDYDGKVRMRIKNIRRTEYPHCKHIFEDIPPKEVYFTDDDLFMIDPF